MKIGFLGKQNGFALEMLTRLRREHPDDEFSAWQPGDKAPSSEFEVIIAVGKVGSREMEGQTKLGLIQMASAGYEGVDVEAATKAGIWVASAPTTKTGNGESVAELAVLLMLAVSRRLNEELPVHLYGAGLDVVKDEPVSKENPLLMEPRIFVTPHIAGSTDLVLDGTVTYLGEVLTAFRQGIRSAGTVNEPGNPKVPLRDSTKT